MFENIIRNLDTALSQLKTLNNEVDNMKDGKEPSLKVNVGVRPMTRLRSSVEDAKFEKDNPSEQEVMDKFSDIINKVFK